MPLIGAADVRLRGLRNPKGMNKNTFWSSPKTISFGEHNTLKAQHFPTQRYSFFHYYNIYFLVDTYLKKRASAQS